VEYVVYALYSRILLGKIPIIRFLLWHCQFLAFSLEGKRDMKFFRTRHETTSKNSFVIRRTKIQFEKFAWNLFKLIFQKP
jgi:hypothetical protein